MQILTSVSGFKITIQNKINMLLHTKKNSTSIRNWSTHIQITSMMLCVNAVTTAKPKGVEHRDKCVVVRFVLPWTVLTKCILNNNNNKNNNFNNNTPVCILLTHFFHVWSPVVGNERGVNLCLFLIENMCYIINGQKLIW